MPTNEQKNRFLHRLRFKYKLVIINETTLTETFRARISRLSLIAWLSIFSLLSFVLLSAIILLTPLKFMLPGYAEMSIRGDVINEALRIDSISMQMNRSDRQLLMLKNIIAGNINADSIETADSLTIEALKKMPLGPTQQEQAFTARYEEENLYNINNLSTTEPKAEEFMFMLPVRGTITKQFEPQNGYFGISILATPDAPVLASQEGYIIHTDIKSLTDNCIIIQHAKGYLTVYRNIGQLLHNVGEHVKAGEAIAFVNSNELPGDINTQIHFELWFEGQMLNPEEYIVF